MADALLPLPPVPHAGEETFSSLLGRANDPLLITPLTNHNNLQYFGPVRVGEQPFQAIFDTGSEALWVPGADCATCPSSHKFDQNASGTFTPGDREGVLTYGTGQVGFRTGQDTVKLCGRDGCGPDAAVAESHSFGIAKHQSQKPFTGLPFDGILGLPPSSEALGRGDIHHSSILGRFLDSVSGSSPASSAPHPHVMGVYLSRDTSVSSSISLGGVESNHIKAASPVHWHNILAPGRSWTVRMSDIAVNGERMHVCPAEGCKALVDTGSSLLTGPSDIMPAVMKKVGDVDRSCSNLTSLPRVEVILQDASGREVSYPLEGPEYAVKFKDGCETGLGALDLSGKKWVLGDTFLRRYYSIFDDDTKQVGLVRSSHGVEGVPIVTSSFGINVCQVDVLIRRRLGDFL